MEGKSLLSVWSGRRVALSYMSLEEKARFGDA
jgi:hypothetical protein